MIKIQAFEKIPGLMKMKTYADVQAGLSSTISHKSKKSKLAQISVFLRYNVQLEHLTLSLSGEPVGGGEWVISILITINVQVLY